MTCLLPSAHTPHHPTLSDPCLTSPLRVGCLLRGTSPPWWRTGARVRLTAISRSDYDNLIIIFFIFQSSTIFFSPPLPSFPLGTALGGDGDFRIGSDYDRKGKMVWLFVWFFPSSPYSLTGEAEGGRCVLVWWVPIPVVPDTKNRPHSSLPLLSDTHKIVPWRKFVCVFTPSKSAPLTIPNQYSLCRKREFMEQKRCRF